MKPLSVRSAARTVRSLRAIAITVVAAATWATPGHARGSLHGSLSGETYTSGGKLFSVAVPKATNWGMVPFEAVDATAGGKEPVDLVQFQVRDFGEVLMACVRVHPALAHGEHMAQDSSGALRSLSMPSLMSWRPDFPVPPTVLLDTLVTTQFGIGNLRVYLAPKGSVLEEGDGANGSHHFDVHIAVLVAVRGDDLIYAIADHEALEITPQPDGSGPESLQAALRSFYQGISVLPSSRRKS